MNWSYQVVEAEDGDTLLSTLDEYGANGWELVTTNRNEWEDEHGNLGISWILFFKQPRTA